MSFTATTGTVTFGAGATTATVTFDPTPDTIVEGDETIDLTVTTGTGYNPGPPASATGTITNDEISVSVSPLSVLEDGAPNLVYTFTRAGESGSALNVLWFFEGNFEPSTRSNASATVQPAPNCFKATGCPTTANLSGSHVIVLHGPLWRKHWQKKSSAAIGSDAAISPGQPIVLLGPVQSGQGGRLALATFPGCRNAV